MPTFLTRDRSVCLQPVSQLAARSLDWLWPGRLALGKLAMLDGDPGMSKSLLALDLCARLSTGRPLPDGSPGPGPVSSIIVNGEDGAEIRSAPGCRPWARTWSVSFPEPDGPRRTRFPTFPRAGAHPGPGAGGNG